MAGGSHYVLNIGIPVLSTYNSSAAAGVTANRLVKWSSGKIDLNTGAAVYSVGVVQENIDQVKVATGKAIASVCIAGVCKVYVATATSVVLGAKVMAGTAGGVLLAATTANFVVGIVVGVGQSGTVGAGDLIDIELTPGVLVP